MDSKRVDDDGRRESEAREKAGDRQLKRALSPESREFLSDRISAAGRSRPLLFLILCAF
ncbi:hypothetical protein BDZ89DRAFT_1079151 [Hymenopellis radicata]|nr:hypothetical protein BDZ89DRAFT_1079151 [Hymenopellis radicata]